VIPQNDCAEAFIFRPQINDLATRPIDPAIGLIALLGIAVALDLQSPILVRQRVSLGAGRLIKSRNLFACTPRPVALLKRVAELSI
jgi:hypothetical protein